MACTLKTESLYCGNQKLGKYALAYQGKRRTLEQENEMVGGIYGVGIGDRSGGYGNVASSGLARQHHQLTQKGGESHGYDRNPA